MNRTQIANGAKITLENVYADEESAVIDFSVQDLKGDRRNAGKPAALEPVLGRGPAGALPPHIGHLTDEAGREFELLGATMEGTSPGDSPEMTRAPKANTAVFALPVSLEPSSNHRFRFEVSLEEMPIPSSWEEAEEGVRGEPKRPIGPFVFDIEIFFRAAEEGEPAAPGP